LWSVSSGRGKPLVFCIPLKFCHMFVLPLLKQIRNAVLHNIWLHLLFCARMQWCHHLRSGCLSSDTIWNKETHILVLPILSCLQHFCYFCLKSLTFCLWGSPFKIQCAYCSISSLIFASSVVNTLVIAKTIQRAIHLVTNVAHRCLWWMGMNILNVAA